MFRFFNKMFDIESDEKDFDKEIESVMYEEEHQLIDKGIVRRNDNSILVTENNVIVSGVMIDLKHPGTSSLNIECSGNYR